MWADLSDDELTARLRQRARTRGAVRFTTEPSVAEAIDMLLEGSP